MSGRPRPRIVERLLARREHHRRRSLPYRIAFAVAGVLVLLAGIAMLVTPGPAFVLIPAGLAMLALEFAWAERLLEASLARAQAAQERARSSSPLQRAACVALAAAAVAAAALAAVRWDIPLLPV